MAKNVRKNKKDKRRRLLLLILLLVLTLGIGTSATVAWFTSNKAVNINPMKVKVRTVNGLQISVDAVEWTAVIGRDDLKDASYTGSKNQLPFYFDAISSDGVLRGDEANGYFPTMWHGSVYLDKNTNVYYLNTTQEGEKKCADSEDIDETVVADCNGNHFMAFDVFLKVDSGTKLYLTANSKVQMVTGENDGLRAAARIGFLNYGTISSSDYTNGVTEGEGDEAITTEGHIVAQNLKSTADSDFIIWEPNYEFHSAYGRENAKVNYGLTIDPSVTSPAIPYAGVYAQCDDVPLNETNASSHGECFADVTPSIKTLSDFTDRQYLMDLPAGVTKVRIYFWIEGNDVDAENYATGADNSLALEFTID